MCQQQQDYTIGNHIFNLQEYFYDSVMQLN